MAQEIVSKTKLPDYLESASKELVEKAKPYADRPFPTYDAPRIAGLTSDQTGAFDLTRQAVGKWEPLTDFASKTWNDTGVVDQYMNPYISTVLADTMAELNRQGAIGRKQIGRSALASNAFGDDRHAILEAEFDRNLADVAGRTANQILAQAYESGRQAFGADRDAQMKLAALIPQLAYQDAGALWGIGSQQQAQNQRNLDLAYDDFIRQVLWPQEQLNWLSGILAGTPYSSTTVQKGPDRGGDNSLAALLGSGAALLGGLGNFLFGGDGIF